MDEKKLFLIPQENAADVWPLAEPFIEQAVLYADGLITTETLQEGVEDGSKRLWLIWGDRCFAAGVTEIIKETCFIWAFGGEEMHKWFPLHTQLEEWAKHEGCKSVHFFGRIGWERILRSSGYERRLVVLRKEL